MHIHTHCDLDRIERGREMIKTKVSVLLAMLFTVAQLAQAQNVQAETAPGGNSLSAEESEMLKWLFNKGVEEYKSANYDDAILMFDGMLAIDKFNSDAVAYKKRAADRIAKIENKQIETTRALAMMATEKAWNQAPNVYGAVALTSGDTRSDPHLEGIERMKEKLRSVRIPSLDFTDSKVEDVLLFLSAASRRYSVNDADLDIVIMGMEHAVSDELVSVSFADMNLYEALKFVAEMMSLKVDIRPNLVAIMPSNYVAPSQVITRSYDVSYDVGADFESLMESDASSDLFGDSFTPSAPTGPIEITEFFSVVDFPIGTSAVYQPRFHKLFVKNTQGHLKEVEAVLNGLEEEARKLRSQQVEIETKFVEFSEGALEELGFDWTVYGNGSVASMQMKEGNYFQEGSGFGNVTEPAFGPAPSPIGETLIYTDPVTGQQLIEPTVGDADYRRGQSLFGSAQRSNGSVFGTVGTGILASMGGAPAAMVIGDGNVDVRITALEQQGTADVLSAPRVTTKSGNEALIRVAETHRYPQDYDVITGQRTSPVVQPQDWADFDMGVSLKVTPVVDTDSGTIDIELQPQIMEFKGYDQYLVGYNAYDGGATDSAVPAGDGSPFLASMAFFERRSAMTQVTIADGSTVVLGGLIGERTETFRDQVPFLGDIPYLGRLFRTEGSRNVKNNLTIFVKATQVDERGMTRAEREIARQTASN
jgi:general secretion pathway protein D